MAKEASVPLHQVEFIVPFVPTDFDMDALLFLETDAQLRGPDAELWKAWLTRELLRLLQTQGYPQRWLDEVTFEFDSHENVVKNFKGSYFYRTR